jgi:hypothetical protein
MFRVIGDQEFAFRLIRGVDNGDDLDNRSKNSVSAIPVIHQKTNLDCQIAELPVGNIAEGLVPRTLTLSPRGSRGLRAFRCGQATFRIEPLF